MPLEASRGVAASKVYKQVKYIKVNIPNYLWLDIKML